MKITRNGVVHTLAFTLATLVATFALVAAGLAEEPGHARSAGCLFCTSP